MSSRTFFVIFLFLLPFALYAAFLRVRGQNESPTPISHPWNILIISGLVLVAASFVFWGLFENANQRGVYVPPHLEDGRLVPGRVVPPGEPSSRAGGGALETGRVETGGRR